MENECKTLLENILRLARLDHVYEVEPDQVGIHSALRVVPRLETGDEFAQIRDDGRDQQLADTLQSLHVVMSSVFLDGR